MTNDKQHKKSGQQCPACSTDDIRTFTDLEVDTGNSRFESEVLECPVCNHRFLALTDSLIQEIERIYDEEYAGFREDPVFAARVREALRKDIEPKVAPPARILDVGCGNGAFMRAAQEYGYTVEGVDISEEGVAYCREQGLQARAGNFLEMDFNGPYDVITMWDVVEHLKRPSDFIERAESLLHDDGILLLKIPGFERTTFYPVHVWGRLILLEPGAPSHIQYFTRTSLSTLLDRCGFGHLDWMQSRSFRSRRNAGSLKTRIGRAYIDMVNWVAGNDNLYLTARPKR